MPIKPENLARYPADWKTVIVPRIRRRSGNKCEWCGVPNGAIGYREDGGRFVLLHRHGSVDDWSGHHTGYKLIKIVLTVAHVHDHTPEACADDNLAHLCQRCHNTHDAPMRRQHAAQSRKAGKAIAELF